MATDKPTPNRAASSRKAARRRGSRSPKPIDPIAVLESIAGNSRLKASTRVSACRELVKIRIAMLGAQKPAASPEARAAEKTDRLAEELNQRALALMNPGGSA